MVGDVVVWFSAATGFIIPSGMSWLVGITWIALPFGAYFGVKLTAEGESPAKTGRAVVVALAGVGFVVLYFFWLMRQVPLGFPLRLIPAWLGMAMAAGFQWFGWPSLFKTLLAYGLASRVPVVVVMFLAMWGHWGTHYDYVGMPPQFQMSLLPDFFGSLCFHSSSCGSGSPSSQDP